MRLTRIALPCPVVRADSVVRLKRRIAGALAALLLGPLLLLATAAELLGEDTGAASTTARTKARLSIQADQLQQHVNVLADDSFEGREAGTRGNRAAAGYIVKHMVDHGLKGAAGEGQYRQTFRKGHNLLGILRGSDPKLADQVVLVGGHFDHVGYGNAGNSFGPTGKIHNGADDNASGTAGVMELIEAFSLLPQAPPRSILFAFWDGEEKGLLGSKHFVKNPTIPLEDIVAAINSDMIGRLRKDRLELYGCRTMAGLRQRISRLNGDSNLRIDFTWEMNANSDHWPFYEQGIPSLMFHTGLHDNYHRPSDDAHLVDAAGMQRVSQLAFELVYSLASQPERPTFREKSRSETEFSRMRVEGKIANIPTRLGISWKETDEGLVISKVTPESAAAQGGLQVDDLMLKMNGERIADGPHLGRMVLASPTQAQFEVRRGEQSVPIDVTLGGKPYRLGLSWREDAGEPGSVIVSRVISYGPAGHAGLRVADRVIEINGKSFADGNELLELIRDVPSPLRLRVERQGRLRELTLQLTPPLAQTDLPSDK